MAKRYYITTCLKYNNSTNVLFLMDKLDVAFRNKLDEGDHDNYILGEQVSSVKRMPKGTEDWEGRSYKLATTVSGRQYYVYSDHSMNEVTDANTTF